MCPTGIEKMLFRRNNIPMTFVLLRLSPLELDELKKLIIDNGGACSITDSKVRIKFTTRSSYSSEMCPDSIMYDVKFIRMCVKSARIVEPEKYRLSRYYQNDGCLMLHFLFGSCECSILHQQEQQQQQQKQQQQPEAVADNETTSNRQMTMRVSMTVTTKVRNGEETNNTQPEDESEVVVPYPQVTNPQAPLAKGGKDVSEQRRNRGKISSDVASRGQFVSDFEECSHRENDNELLTLGLPKKLQKKRTATTLTANSKSQSVESFHLNDVAKCVPAARSPVHSEASTLLVEGLRSPNDELRSRSTTTNQRHEDVGRRAQKHCASPKTSSTHISDCSPARKCRRGNINKEKTGVSQVVNPFYQKKALGESKKTQPEGIEDSESASTPKPAIKIESEIILEEDSVMQQHVFKPVRTAIKMEQEPIGNIETLQLASPIRETMKIEHRSIENIEKSQSPMVKIPLLTDDSDEDKVQRRLDRRPQCTDDEDLFSRLNRRREAGDDSAWNQPGPSGLAPRLGTVETVKNMSPPRNDARDSSCEESMPTYPRRRRSTKHKSVKNDDARVGLRPLGPVKTANNVSPHRNNTRDSSSEESTLPHPRPRKSTKHNSVKKDKGNVSPRRNEIPDSSSEESTPLHPRTRKSTKHSAVQDSDTDIDEISDLTDSDEPKNRQKGRRHDFDPKKANAWKHTTVAKKLMRKAPYTDHERKIMLRYLIRTGTIHLAKGIKVFDQMTEEPGLQHRTPMSLNLHFLRHILPFVDRFAIAFKLDKASVAKLKKLAG